MVKGPAMVLVAQRFAGSPTLQKCVTAGYRVLAGEPDTDAVRRIQASLGNVGYPCGTIDGAFGNNTGTAVSAFKRDMALSPTDPVVGSGTMTALDGLRAVDPDSALRRLLSRHRLPAAGHLRVDECRRDVDHLRHRRQLHPAGQRRVRPRRHPHRRAVLGEPLARVHLHDPCDRQFHHHVAVCGSVPGLRRRRDAARPQPGVPVPPGHQPVERRGPAAAPARWSTTVGVVQPGIRRGALVVDLGPEGRAG
ncbi:MAG: hypothetical protein E6Q90_12000 [Actinobacteria bacterium]|nr:MAG: hypothetical protein E6Q90_12000 [Actinomycetota bacterium]